MAVIHGSKADVFLNGYNAGDWFSSVTSQATKELNDATTLNNSGYKAHYARMRDATFTMNGFFDAANAVDFATNTTLDPDTGDYALNAMIQGGIVGSANDVVLHAPGGANAVGDLIFGAKGAATTYGLEGSSSDLLGASVELTSCCGRERCVLAKTLAQATNTFTGTSIDNTSSTTAGGSAYLMVTAFTSGTVPVIIEHSPDGISWSTLATFATVNAAHAFERITFSGTVNRYVRAAATGTYVATFLVAIHRN